MNPPNAPNHHISREVDPNLNPNVRHLTEQAALASAAVAVAASSHQHQHQHHSVPSTATAMQDRSQNPNHTGVSTYGALSESGPAKTSQSVDAQGDVIMKRDEDTHRSRMAAMAMGMNMGMGMNMNMNMGMHTNMNMNINPSARMSFPNSNSNNNDNSNPNHTPPQAVPVPSNAHNNNRLDDSQSSSGGVYNSNLALGSGFGGGGRRMMDLDGNINAAGNIKAESASGSASTSGAPLFSNPHALADQQRQQQQQSQMKLDTAGTSAHSHAASSSSSITDDHPRANPKKPLTAAETALLAVQQFRNKANMTSSSNAVSAAAAAAAMGTGTNTEPNMDEPKAQAFRKNSNASTPMDVDADMDMRPPESEEGSDANTFGKSSELVDDKMGVGVGPMTNESNRKNRDFASSSSKESSNHSDNNMSAPAAMQLQQQQMEVVGTMQQQQSEQLQQSRSSEGQGRLQPGMLSAVRPQPPPISPPPPPPQPVQPSVAFGHMRELKVEDALNYLDQVKIEFGSRPRIYNEFLEIMKNFKAHELDTPGVIMRVSDLFRGFNKLILGFNTFLPDGFKISIKDLEEGGRYASKKGPNVNAMGPQNGNASAGLVQGRSSGGQGFMGMGGNEQQPPPLGMHGGRGRTGQSLQALHGNRVTTFAGGIPGAPPAELSNDMQRFKQSQQNQGIHPPPAQASEIDAELQQHLGIGPQQQPQNSPAPHGGQPDNGQNGPPPQAVEFDHAITYVTTIKKRFATEPRTYQQFLEILHTYQKEQRGIREVLEQVSSLFADHPDLLREFTYFLPEAVQEQAKERLQAAAAEAEARQAAARQRAMETANQFATHQFHPNHAVGQSPGGTRGGNQEIIDMTKKQQPIADGRSVSSPGQRKRPHSPSNITLQYPIMPETMIYSAGVERQFFDMAKEALRSSSRDGELAWAEFLKCMHYYAQEILSKNDLLRYMEDLLGKQHADLFEEFKRILAAAGAPGAPSHDDTWHSVPLSEIDFSRCRRCTPSYRALPRDYPVAPFSGRCAEEAKLLNDVWISLPDGSEESYTFRHMRKNQHEEVLFRCEDERFEIDMVIDSNATTLKRLEPIAEEIAMLQQREGSIDGKEKSGSKSTLEKGGLAGKTIKYSFDKRILNTIHRHAISRIYGDAGQEMLELMHKNPVVAVPIIVKRLKQKDRDFRAAREVLNIRWKELAEINYYKSIDHRSLTWRTIDKRATSTRTLVAEIKDRAANSGTESEPAVMAKKEKAKEEFGSFYERTMGHYLAKKMDLTNLPKPAESLFTPHYSMKYDNNSWAQRDAYRILSFALERGSISPGDKERCHRIWKDFLAPFFELSNIWMQSPAVAYAASPHHNSPSIVSNGEDSGNEEDESSTEENDIIGDMMVTEEVLKDCSSDDAEAGSGFSLLDNQPIPSGTVVSTLYGEGTVVKYLHTEKTCVVSLPFGATAYLNRDSVLCTILPVDQFDLQHSIPSVENPLERDDDKLILGPQSLYLFFRLHQVLIKRLNTARELAFSVDNDQSLCTLIEHMEADGSAPVGQKRYDAYMSLVYSLVEGGYNSPFQGGSANAAEGGKYEDRVRCLLGHEAYELATMDKLVSHILKHLQNLANDDTMQGMIQIFKKQFESGSFKPLTFRHEAAMISEGENVFAFQYCKIPKSDSTIMHAQLLGCITDEDDEDDDSDKASLTGMEVPDTNDGPAPKKLKRD